MPRRSISPICEQCFFFCPYEKETSYFKNGFGMCRNIDAEPLIIGVSIHPFKVKPCEITSCKQQRRKDDEDKGRATEGKAEESEEEGDNSGFQGDLQESLLEQV